jgi:hypothetical protein
MMLYDQRIKFKFFGDEMNILKATSGEDKRLIY